MQTKLTLRLDDDLIRQAKEYARRSGKSVSEIVADFFQKLSERHCEGDAEQLPPAVAALVGAMAGSNLDEDVYRQHLERKHA